MENILNYISKQHDQFSNEVNFDYKKWFDLYCSIECLYSRIKADLTREQDWFFSIPFLDDANRKDPLSYGQCGDNVYWKVIDYVLYIGGTGDMWDFNMNGIDDDDSKEKIISPWVFSEYSNVIIQNGVTSIGKYAFYDASIESVMIPASVQTIKEGAFFETLLTQLELPPTIQTIEPDIIAADPCRVDKLIVAANIPNIEPEAFYTRYLAPDEIVLTGELPDDLSALVKSGLFAWPCGKITYPHTWDTDKRSFFEKLSEEISNQGIWEHSKVHDEDSFADLKESLVPYMP